MSQTPAQAAGLAKARRERWRGHRLTRGLEAIRHLAEFGELDEQAKAAIGAALDERKEERT